MKSFLDFVNESAPMNKAQYAEVRRKLGRELENAFKSATNTYLNSLAPNPADRSENDTFQDLYYSKPDTIPSFKSFGKKLDKFKGADRESPVFKAYLAAWESMKDRVAEVDAMKDGVVSATTQREVKKSAEVAKIQKYVKDNGALINVLNSNREEYKREAADRAAKQYDYYAEVLKAAGYNLDVAAPVPESRIGRGALAVEYYGIEVDGKMVFPGDVVVVRTNTRVFEAEFICDEGRDDVVRVRNISGEVGTVPYDSIEPKNADVVEIGEWVMINGDPYIVAMVGVDEWAMISAKSGNRFNDPEDVVIVHSCAGRGAIPKQTLLNQTDKIGAKVEFCGRIEIFQCEVNDE